jgi:hypothetical protein
VGTALLAVAWLGLGCVGVRDPGGTITGRVVGTGPEQAARVEYLESLTHAKATDFEPPAWHQLTALPGEIHLDCSLHSSEDAVLLAEGTVRASAPIRVRRDASLAIGLPLQLVSEGSD